MKIVNTELDTYRFPQSCYNCTTYSVKSTSMSFLRSQFPGNKKRLGCCSCTCGPLSQGTTGKYPTFRIFTSPCGDKKINSGSMEFQRRFQKDWFVPKTMCLVVPALRMTYMNIT
uniref:Uncharacterized protein n=1 Tax=Gibberella zeae TaxID=5518 RepID=A0A4E9DSM1_GIBZA